MNKTAEIPAEAHHADEIGAKLGMWLFLFTELLLFGGMFILYSIYRSSYSHEFFLAASELDTFIGTVNTIALLTSSLTVALSIEALRRGNRKLSITMLSVTILFGILFMINKYFEWSTKIHHGIYPGGEVLLNMTDGEMLFFNLYYVMTGLHGLHVLIGISVLSVMLYFIVKRPTKKISFDYETLSQMRGAKLEFVGEKDSSLNRIGLIDDDVENVKVQFKYAQVPDKMDKSNLIKLENSGLYWHLVDIIWIFLFPLFYLIS